MEQFKGIQIRVNYERLEAMNIAFEGMAEDYTPTEAHEYLLLCHLMHLARKTKKMLDRNQSIYTLRLEQTEALAFKQIWAISGRYQDRYTQVVVGAMLKKINDANPLTPKP